MKAIILAGGFGTRLAEETQLKPKPMVEVGGKPMLWHIMNIYAAGGVTEFVVALGYKSKVIKDYFLNFSAINSDISIDLSSGKTTIREGEQPNWKIHLVDTGLHTQTGGRLKRLAHWIGEDETFLFTYGDGVADLDIRALLRFHRSHGKLATVTTVRAPARNGHQALDFDRNHISDLHDGPNGAGDWINGGYFALSSRVIDYIDGDESVWEHQPLERLARDGQLMAHRHYGFWSCMDTLEEKNALEELWARGKAPWRIWQTPVAAKNGSLHGRERQPR
ncbi:MAG: glucose-1-phosphate cytidylyltransferase [Gemmatimonadota bacterium]|nr:MAG: glucose-1-phosphate cytidylyltransferase [Gemmatimonadota bacterium]